MCKSGDYGTNFVSYFYRFILCSWLCEFVSHSCKRFEPPWIDLRMDLKITYIETCEIDNRKLELVEKYEKVVKLGGEIFE